MKQHREMTAALSEYLSRYVLGALDRAEAKALEAHVNHCAVCRREVSELHNVMGELAACVPPMTPSPDLRNRLLDTLPIAPRSGQRALDPSLLTWQPSEFPGVSFHWLRHNETTGEAAAFVKILPGCPYADHRHHGGEDCVVLQGGFSDRRGEYHAGDFVYYEPGSVHENFRALPGETCILFVVCHHGGMELLTSPCC